MFQRLILISDVSVDIPPAGTVEVECLCLDPGIPQPPSNYKYFSKGLSKDLEVIAKGEGGGDLPIVNRGIKGYQFQGKTAAHNGIL
jgi:hypothetical protein